MAENIYPVPASMAEATAAQAAASAFYLIRIEALQAVLDGPEAQALERALAAEVEMGVPSGTSASANIPSLTSWFNSIRSGLAADRAQLIATIEAAMPSVPEDASTAAEVQPT